MQGVQRSLNMCRIPQGQFENDVDKTAICKELLSGAEELATLAGVRDKIVF